jgi:hypothetical protein
MLSVTSTYCLWQCKYSGEFKIEFKQICMHSNYGIKDKTPATSIYCFWQLECGRIQTLVQINTCENYGIKIKPSTSHNKLPTSKCNHWASTQSCVMSMTCSDHLISKIIMKILKHKDKKIIHLITFFNHLHDY